MKNIVLVGCLLTGKTTLGKKVSEIININFIDTDEYIVKKVRKEHGNKDFFTLRNLLIEEHKRFKNYFEVKELSLISTGAELASRDKMCPFLKELGTIINIKRDSGMILKEIKDNYPEEWKINNSKNNSNGYKGDINESIVYLYKDEESYFENMADYTIINNGNEEEGVKKLIAIIKKIWENESRK